MIRFIIIILTFFLVSCSKPKTVLICGNHICVNNSEAEQYFEENLSIEVKVIDRKDKKSINLVELNLKKDELGNKEISISKKKNLKENLKVLSNEEVIKIKKNIKNKREINKVVKKNKIKEKPKKKTKSKKLVKKTKTNLKTNENRSINVDNKKKDIVDICTILEKCSIDEISKYLINKGKNKKFPDITKRQ